MASIARLSPVALPMGPDAVIRQLSRRRLGLGSSGSIRLHCASVGSSNRRLLVLPAIQTPLHLKSTCLEAEAIYETGSMPSDYNCS